MKIQFKITTIGNPKDYIGLPILDKMSMYNFNDDENFCKQESKAIGVITKIIESNEDYTVIEGEIFNKFINVGYEFNQNCNGDKSLSCISLEFT